MNSSLVYYFFSTAVQVIHTNVVTRHDSGHFRLLLPLFNLPECIFTYL